MSAVCDEEPRGRRTPQFIETPERLAPRRLMVGGRFVACRVIYDNGSFRSDTRAI